MLETQEVHAFTCGMWGNQGEYTRKRLEYRYFDKSKRTLLLVRTDITALYQEHQQHTRELEAALKWAKIDPLTGLLNRQGIQEAVQATLEDPNRKAAFLFMDLDNFKLVNDTYGHTAGDHVLQAAAEILRKNIHSGDYAARIGGDEFVVFLSAIRDLDDAADCARRICEQIPRFQLDAEALHLTCSIGVSIAPRDGSNYGALVKKADEKSIRRNLTAKVNLPCNIAKEHLTNPAVLWYSSSINSIILCKTGAIRRRKAIGTTPPDCQPVAAVQAYCTAAFFRGPHPGGERLQQVLRNERKFLLNTAEFMKKKHQLQQLLHEDPHNGPEGYRIRSLYFDTEYDGDYFDKQFGLEVRKKLRLRLYDPAGDFAMLEMKQKQNVQQRKRSLRISREDALRLIRGDYAPLLRYREPFAAECYALMHTRCYRPRTIVEYRRMAFIAKENNIRVTFDHRIEATQSSFGLFDPHLLMTPVMDWSQVVMEVKYNGFLLSYIKDLLGDLGKSELSVSKYCMARQFGCYEHL